MQDPTHADTLKDDFECIICLEMMFDPVTFSCGHSVCRLCAVDHLEAISSVRMKWPRCALNCEILTLKVPKVSTTLRNAIAATQPADELAARALQVRPRSSTLATREEALARKWVEWKQRHADRVKREMQQQTIQAAKKAYVDGQRIERARTSAFLQADPRRAIIHRDGALRVAIKRHKNKEKSETLIAVAAAVASMAILGLV